MDLNNPKKKAMIYLSFRKHTLSTFTTKGENSSKMQKCYKNKWLPYLDMAVINYKKK